jgi:hypothetical protein
VSSPQIHIPDNLPDEARCLVEEVTALLAAVAVEVAELNKDPESFSAERRREVITKSRNALRRFEEMHEQLRAYGMEQSDWPNLIEE